MDTKIDFAGRGGKRPQIEIPISQILLDDENPRLVQYLDSLQSPTQYDLTKILYDNFDTESVALSLSQNGYFDEEPIIVIPNDLPQDFNFEDYSYEELSKKLKDLVSTNKTTFTVVEGNRRVSSIKLLTDTELRNKLGIDRYYPKVANTEIVEDISLIPCIVYHKRGDVNKYLGVRHIAGLLKWEAFAKAAYIANSIEYEVEKGLNQNEAIKEVQRVVGDRSDTLKKQYVAYKLYQEALHDLSDFEIKPLVNKFSLLNVMYNSPAIRNYIGVEAYSKVDFDNRVVPVEKLNKFEEVLTWIFGNVKKHETPILTDSRKITDTLSYVVASDNAIEYLKKYKDLDGAFERTNGDKEFLLKNLSRAFRTVRESLSFAYKFEGDQDILEKVKELEEVISALKNNLSK